MGARSTRGGGPPPPLRGGYGRSPGLPRLASFGFAVCAILLGVSLVTADVGPPAHVQVTESSPGRYTVRWRVPKALPPRAIPVPVLPETCRPEGERSVEDRPGAWLLTRDWACDAGLAGQEVGVRYPFASLSLTTVFRVDLLSGDRFAHVFSPGEGQWRVPEGTAPPDPIAGARRAVVAGGAHAAGSAMHLAFVLLLSLFGGFAPALRLVTAFTAGQLAGVAITAVSGIGLPEGLARLALAIGVVLLARHLLGAGDATRRLVPLALGTGLVHGLGLAALLADDLGAAPEPGTLAVAVLGMDAVHLVGTAVACAALAVAGRALARDRPRTGLAYALGAAGMAFALALAVSGEASTAATPRTDGLPGGGSRAAGPAGSQRLAPSAPDAPIQSFVAVEPFEVRHEVMLRLAGLPGIDPEAPIEVEDQPLLADSLARMVVGLARLTVDGSTPPPLVRRADFMTVDPTGALPRPTPVPEDPSEAVLGVVVTYPTAGMPERVALTWDPFPASVARLPVTIIDPENAASDLLDPGTPGLEWRNALEEDPIPSVEAVPVEPARVPVPLLSLPLIALAAILAVAGMRGRRPAAAYATARIVLAAALVVGPAARTSLAVPGSAGRAPSERQARRILSGLLPNVYRALEFGEESAIYDRLAVSVTGETLTEVYLEQRRALEMEERGGAQARVETVEVLEAGDVDREADGFSVRAEWTVGGMVTHFGHRHFRQSRYDARLALTPAEGAWKIRSIEVLDQERLR